MNKLARGDRSAIENSIKTIGDQMQNKRYEIRIKAEELKELKRKLERLKSSQQWRKDMIEGMKNIEILTTVKTP